MRAYGREMSAPRPFPLATLGVVLAVVLGFDVAASCADRFGHIAYLTFALPDLVVFATLGFVLVRREHAWTAFGLMAIAAVVEASGGRALATALGAEPPPPGTTIGFLVLETFVVAVFTLFWGSIGIALGAIGRRPR